MKTCYQKNTIKCEEKNSSIHFFLLLFCLIALCFGTHVSAFSTALGYVECGRLAVTTTQLQGEYVLRFFSFGFVLRQ